MKLYATTQRGFSGVSKGVGGNEFLTTTYKMGNKEVGRVMLRYEEHSGYTLYYYPITATTGKGGRILLHEEKGKQQKDEQVKVKTERTHTQGKDWHN